MSRSELYTSLQWSQAWHSIAHLFSTTLTAIVSQVELSSPPIRFLCALHHRHSPQLENPPYFSHNCSKPLERTGTRRKDGRVPSMRQARTAGQDQRPPRLWLPEFRNRSERPATATATGADADTKYRARYSHSETTGFVLLPDAVGEAACGTHKRHHSYWRRRKRRLVTTCQQWHAKWRRAEVNTRDETVFRRRSRRDRGLPHGRRRQFPSTPGATG